MTWRVRPEDRAPDPPPLVTDDRIPLSVGTAVWVVLGVLALLGRARLDAAGHGWWVGACAAGVALGVVALLHEHRRRARR